MLEDVWPIEDVYFQYSIQMNKYRVASKSKSIFTFDMKPLNKSIGVKEKIIEEKS